MTDNSVSRRKLLRVGGTVASVGAVTALAGCSDSGNGNGSGDGSGNPSGIDTVPSGAAAVVKIDIEGLRTSEEFTSSINNVLSSIDQVPDSVEEIESTAQTESGADPSKLSEVVAYGSAGSDGSTPTSGSTQNGGAVVWTDWSKDELTTVIENNAESESVTITETEYSGKTILESDSEMDSGVIGVLGGGTYAVGPRGEVTAMIDVWNGDADPVSGTVRSQYESAPEGLVRFGFTVPESMQTDNPTGPTDQIQRGNGSLSSEGRIEVAATVDSADTASQLVTQLENGIEQAKTQIQNGQSPYPELNQPAIAALEATTVSSDGATITVTNDKGFDLLTTFGGLVVGAFVLGFGGSATGQTSR